MDIRELDFNGTWAFRSFFNDLQNPEEPLYMGPWAAPAQLEVSPNRGLMIKGTLQFASGPALNVTGWTTPCSESAPASAGSPGQQSTPSGLILYAEGAGAVYELRGFAVTPTSIVGTVRCRTGDLTRRADGTVGPFILFRDSDCQAMGLTQAPAVPGNSRFRADAGRPKIVRTRAILRSFLVGDHPIS